MFTGIVTQLGKIKSINQDQFTIASDFENIQEGESISVNGVCLTAVSPRSGEFVADISVETRQCTTANKWQEGQGVHLERALRAQDRMGGHFVQGHVDAVAYIEEMTEIKENLTLKVKWNSENALFRRYLVPKGSIAVDGVSLTLNALFEDGFEVMLIPHTLEKTHFKQLNVHSHVNIEFDCLIKALVEQVKHIEGTSWKPMSAQ